MMPELLFLDDKPSRHRAFAERARAAGARIVHVRTPAETMAVLRDRGHRLAAVYLDRDLGLHETGEDVAEAMARLPRSRRPPRVYIHSHNIFGSRRMEQILLKAGYPRVERIRFKF